MFNKILVPIFSIHQISEVLHQAINLATSHGGQLVILSVFEKKSSKKIFSESITTVIDSAKVRSGIDCLLISKAGKALAKICDIANELKVDLIVIGVKDISLESSSQSTASRVISLANCPVFIVP